MSTRMATEFPSEEALKKYLKEHPKADPKKHSVAESGGESEKKEPEGKQPQKRYRYPSALMSKGNLYFTDADEVEAFAKKTKSLSGDKQTDAQVMKKFLAGASPGTKKKVETMTPAEFMGLVKALLENKGFKDSPMYKSPAAKPDAKEPKKKEPKKKEPKKKEQTAPSGSLPSPEALRMKSFKVPEKLSQAAVDNPVDMLKYLSKKEGKDDLPIWDVPKKFADAFLAVLDGAPDDAAKKKAVFKVVEKATPLQLEWIWSELGSWNYEGLASELAHRYDVGRDGDLELAAVEYLRTYNEKMLKTLDRGFHAGDWGAEAKKNPRWWNDYGIEWDMGKKKKAMANSATRIAARYLDMVACDCGDELFAGREHGEGGKGYGESGPDVRGPGKWQPKPKGKCYYETGDEKDRCYVTQHGGPGGQKKPGPATKPGDWKTYEKQRWKGAALSHPEDEEGALKALKVFAKKAELPFAIQGIENREYPVKSPKGFGSLFDKLYISVEWWQPSWCKIQWGYTHPSGGSNGLNIGSVGWDVDKEKWYWKLDTGKYGWIN